MLSIDPGIDPFNNTGTLQAESGASLRLLSGTFNNAGGSIEADGPGSKSSGWTRPGSSRTAISIWRLTCSIR